MPLHMHRKLSNAHRLRQPKQTRQNTYSERYYWKTQHSSAVSPDGHVQRNQSPAACIPPWLHSFPSSHCKLTPSAFCPPPPWAPPHDPRPGPCHPPAAPETQTRSQTSKLHMQCPQGVFKHFWTLNSHLKNVKMSWHMLEIFSELTFLK